MIHPRLLILIRPALELPVSARASHRDSCCDLGGSTGSRLLSALDDEDLERVELAEELVFGLLIDTVERLLLHEAAELVEDLLLATVALLVFVEQADHCVLHHLGVKKLHYDD